MFKREERQTFEHGIYDPLLGLQECRGSSSKSSWVELNRLVRRSNANKPKRMQCSAVQYTHTIYKLHSFSATGRKVYDRKSCWLQYAVGCFAGRPLYGTLDSDWYCRRRLRYRVNFQFNFTLFEFFGLKFFSYQQTEIQKFGEFSPLNERSFDVICERSCSWLMGW